MRIVVDTNIVFSAILNSNSKISYILLTPKSRLNFYSTEHLIEELIEHKNKLQEITGYSEKELLKLIQIISRKIKFIDVRLIPNKTYEKSLQLTTGIDEDDTEFVALTNHIRGKLWSGDKELKQGLQLKNWRKFISTEELYRIVTKK